MPIPAPEPYRKSNLTKQQRAEQLAAVYGVPMPTQLSHEEVERMRQIVQMHDSERKPMTIVDLNNPPKEQYRFQKFPLMLYRAEAGKATTLIVHSEEQLQDAIESGWSQSAEAFRDEPADTLKPAYQAEVSRVEAQLQESRSRNKKTAVA